MNYRTVYDLTQEPAFDPYVALLAGGFIATGLLWRSIQRNRDKRQAEPPRRTFWTTPNVLWLFGLIIAFVGVGLMGWDHMRLVSAMENGEARVVEGPVQSWGTERQRTADTKRRAYRTYERFYVGDSIWFGYWWEVEQAGFHNAADPRVAFTDGMPVRATYLHADGPDEPPRIVKLELIER
jgi:hypothetical protein